MTFITKVTLNAAKSGARFLVSNPQAIHAAVMKSFSEDAIAAMDKNHTGRVLYRLETHHRDPALYIFSPVVPDVAHIVEQAGRVNDETGVVSKNYDPVLDSVETGSRYKFSTRVNPVKRHGSKTFGHVTIDQILTWFETKAESCGFTIDSAVTDVKRDGSLSFKNKQNKVNLRWADVEGVLTVTDAALFVESMKFGIGRARGYGMGMITLARV